MRTKHLLLFFAVLVAGGFTAVNTISTDGYQNTGSENKSGITQDFKSAQKEMTDSGFYFDVAVLQDIRQNLKNEVTSQVGDNLNWKSVGPNNVAGRIRAIVVDKTAEEHNVLYAGSATGGIFKSNTNGQYWEQVNIDYDAGVMAITSMVQANDGTIYATTGEVFDSIVVSKMKPSFYPGVGVLKKAPGSDSFQLMTTTDPIENGDFFGITQIALDPGNNQNMYLSTWKGLYKSTNAGSTWDKVTALPSSYVSDIQINENGVVVASAQGKVYVNSGTGFVDVSGHAANMIDSGGVRYEFAFAPTNPDYLYAIAAGEDERLLGVYRSTSAGAPETWEKIAIGGSDEFSIFRETKTIRNSSYVTYNGIDAMMLTVDDEDENYVYIGGSTLWAGYKVEGVTPYQWTQKSYNTLPEYHPLFLTANIHTMVAHPEGDVYYIGCDGGVFRYEDGVGSARLNSYLNTGQFYDVSIGPNGSIIGGAQDNGIFLNRFDGPGSQKFFGTKILEPDVDAPGNATHGFRSVISQVNPEIFLYEHSHARLRRTLDNGKSIKAIYDTIVSEKKNWSWAVENAPMAMWESEDYEFGYDTYTYKVYETLIPPTEDTVESRNIAGIPIYLPVEDTIYKDSIVSYEDPYKSIFAIGVKGQIWLTHKATSNLQMFNWDWIDVFHAYEMYDAFSTRYLNATVEDLVFSADGHHLYVTVGIETDTVTKTEFYRLDSLHTVMNNARYAWSLANQPMYPDTIPNDIVLGYTQKLGQLYTREGSSVAIDPNNKGTLVVTLLNYDDEDKVYLCENANTTESEVFSENFESIQSNLPKIAVFDGLVNVNSDDNKKQLMLGTEAGIWSTDDYTANNPLWKYNSTGMGPVPVTSIKQQTYNYDDYSKVNNYGIIYASTFGGGIYIDSTYYVPRTENSNPETPSTVTSTNTFGASVYPNPVKNRMTVEFLTVDEKSSITVRIIDLTGQVLYTENIGQYSQGNYTYDIQAQNLEMGIYLVEISNGRESEIVKVVKN